MLFSQPKLRHSMGSSIPQSRLKTNVTNSQLHHQPSSVVHNISKLLQSSPSLFSKATTSCETDATKKQDSPNSAAFIKTMCIATHSIAKTSKSAGPLFANPKIKLPSKSLKTPPDPLLQPSFLRAPSQFNNKNEEGGSTSLQVHKNDVV
ncbi:hypothetical protein L3X38_023638 [Prunus dulcis]|uniref:Uncharacterized protein n=1 Tax=Prunus dulcis TaxID=3755 RepID=A0AAD4W072_PRUDU|nr:hypothetical protein L3X38_023638 [Prunus dulcis]